MVRDPLRKTIVGGVVLAVAALFVAAPSFAAETKKFSAGLGMNFATGDYGTDSTTDSLRVPFTLDYFPTERLDFELVIPYLYQSNSNTILAGGTRFPFERHGGMRQTSFDTSDSQSGLGDISLTAGYLLLTRSETLPSVRALLYLKFPTADEDEGLGTGEFDIGAGIGAAKWFGLWYTFAEGRYILQGSNSDLGLKDYGTLEGKLGYRMTERFLPTISLWWSTPPADDASDLVEARLNGTYWITDDVFLEGYLGKGLSDETADFGAGLAVFYRF
jgi:hypothetical protein